MYFQADRDESGWDRASRWVLTALLDEPRHWTHAELVTSLALGETEVADALSHLASFGLVHRTDRFAFASRAAVECMRLFEFEN